MRKEQKPHYKTNLKLKGQLWCKYETLLLPVFMLNALLIS